MKKIQYFGKEYTVRFDTDPAPKRSRQKRGITCTLISDSTTVVGRAECSVKDHFVRETGEALSLQRALDSISDKIVRDQKRLAFNTLRESVETIKVAGTAKKMSKRV